MYKEYVVQLQDDSLHIIKANHRPNAPNYKIVYDVPEGVEKSSDVKIVDTVDQYGNPIKKVELDQIAKDARLAAETSDAAAAQLIKDANQYKEDRKAAYPSVGDQMDAIYKKLALGDSTDYDAIAAQIAQVKTDNPKPV